MRIGVDNLVIDSGMEVQLLNGADVVEGDIIDINCRHTQTFICISIALTVQGKINGPWNIGHSNPLLFWGQASGYTDTVSQAIMFIHQIIFKI